MFTLNHIPRRLVLVLARGFGIACKLRVRLFLLQQRLLGTLPVLEGQLSLAEAGPHAGNQTEVIMDDLAQLKELASSLRKMVREVRGRVNIRAYDYYYI